MLVFIFKGALELEEREDCYMQFPGQFPLYIAWNGDKKSTKALKKRTLQDKMRVAAWNSCRPYFKLLKKSKTSQSGAKYENLTVKTQKTLNPWCDENCFKHGKPLKYCQKLLKLNYETSKISSHLYLPVLSHCDRHTDRHAIPRLMS